MIADFCSLVKANRGRENRGKEKRINTRKNYGSETNSIARKGSRGKFPLAESRGSASGRVWGNAPIVPRQTCSKEEVKQSRGSEASRAQTSRVLRRAPKRLYPPSMLCRARWARPRCWACDHSCSFPNAGDFTPVTADPAHFGARKVYY